MKVKMSFAGMTFAPFRLTMLRSLSMHPILTRYGSFFLYSFTVVMIVGIAAGLGITAWRARQLVMDKTSDWLDTFYNQPY